METTRAYKLTSRILYFVSIFFITVFFADGFYGPFYYNRKYRTVKILLCIIVPAVTLRFNTIAEKSLKFIGKSTAVIMSCFIAGFLLFNIIKVPPFSFKEMASLFHIAYALMCLFSVLFFATLFSGLEKAEDYNAFYNDFFLGYVPVLILIYYLLYFNYRNPDMVYSVNLIPFKGEIKSVFENSTELSILRTVGNIAYYSTIALTVSRFVKKHTALISFLIPFLLCLLTESAQGLFSIGSTDIDDVILNSAGALVGALIYKFIIEKTRRNSKCSE